MKKIILILAIFLESYLFSYTNRDIFSITDYNFSNNVRTIVYENSFIKKVSKNFSLVLKLYFDKGDFFENNIYTLGIVFNTSKFNYFESTYGYGIDSNDKRANYYSLEFTMEKERLLYGIGYKFSQYENLSVNLFSPFLQYYIFPNTRFWLKHFSSVDTKNVYDYSNWFELEQFLNKLSFKVGFTNGDRLYDVDYTKTQSNYFYSVIFGLSYKFNEKVVLKYIYEIIEGESFYKGNKNIFVIDIKF